MTVLNALAKTALYYIPGSPGWRSVVREISPVEATELLRRNTSNRKLRVTVVKRYTEIMRSGHWLLTPEPIIMTASGRLINGQHRLTALVDAGVSCKFLLTLEVEGEVYRALDRGAMRSVSDATGIENKLVAVCNVIVAQLMPNVTSTDDVVAEVAKILRGPYELLMNESTNARVPMFSSAPFKAAACLRIMEDRQPDYVLKLYRDLCLGHVSELPPLAQYIVGAVTTGQFGTKRKGSGNQFDLLLRAWDIFDYSKRNNIRLFIKSPENRLGEMRDILNDARGNDGR